MHLLTSRWWFDGQKRSVDWAIFDPQANLMLSVSIIGPMMRPQAGQKCSTESWTMTLLKFEIDEEGLFLWGHSVTVSLCLHVITLGDKLGLVLINLTLVQHRKIRWNLYCINNWGFSPFLPAELHLREISFFQNPVRGLKIKAVIHSRVAAFCHYCSIRNGKTNLKEEDCEVVFTITTYQETFKTKKKKQRHNKRQIHPN